MKIFISHSGNQDVIKSLADDLKFQVHEVWYDDKLRGMGGQPWWSNILAEIRNCDVFLFAFSPESVNSIACQREFQYADTLGKSVLPVKISKTDNYELPEALEKMPPIQYVNFTERDADSAHSLVASLRNLPPSKSLPDPLPPEPERPPPRDKKQSSGGQQTHIEETGKSRPPGSPRYSLPPMYTDDDLTRNIKRTLKNNNIKSNALISSSGMSDDGCESRTIAFDPRQVEQEGEVAFCERIERALSRELGCEVEANINTEDESSYITSDVDSNRRRVGRIEYGCQIGDAISVSRPDQ